MDDLDAREGIRGPDGGILRLVAHHSPDVAGIRGTTVLVADDEDAVRMVSRMQLETFGFNVLTAADGDEALDVYREHESDVDAVLLDMTMPRLSGPETLVELRAIDPDVQVVVVSGLGEADVAEQFDGSPPSAFLQKPFEMNTLIETVSGLVRESRRAA